MFNLAIIKKYHPSKITDGGDILKKTIKAILCFICSFTLSFAVLTVMYLYGIQSGIIRSHGNNNSDNIMSDGKFIGAFSSLQQNRLLTVVTRKSGTHDEEKRRFVSAGGELIGIQMQTDGLEVIATEKFETENGMLSPGENAGIKEGDILLEADGKKLTCINDFTETVRSGGGKAINLLVKRNGENMNTVLTPCKTVSTGMFKAGLWIRDSLGGIGTLTYSDTQNGTFGALGHGIYDGDTGRMIACSGGDITSAVLTGVEKGTSGKAGQLCGSAGENVFGALTENNEKGVYGILNAVNGTEEIYPVAYPDEVHTGPAQIISTVTNNGRQYYDIEIERTDGSSDGKDMTIKITDNSLLSITGGIVRGMSGSPIIQDGMLVGAVTHVFINDPSRGYGIFAEEMLRLSDGSANSENIAA